jgi:L-seryl-tRNA(Ser) seleniumtransferase
LAALEATLVSHQKELADAEVPVIQMLSLTAEEVAQRARSVIEGLDAISVELVPGESTLGGGAGPTSNVPTSLIAITHSGRSAQEIEHHLRTWTPPIIGRISEGKVLLDLRTVFDDQLQTVRAALSHL